MINYMKYAPASDPNKAVYDSLDVANRAVIVFGGSYGGMLAAWLRMKYPQTFHGAHAASAPILFTPGSISPYGFNEIITRDFAEYGADCPKFVRKGQFSLREAASEKTKYPSIKTAFNTCDDITTAAEVETLANLVNGAFGTYAMVNYPYPADLLGELPALPVKESCDNYSKLDITKASDADIWAASAKGMNYAFA